MTRMLRWWRDPRHHRLAMLDVAALVLALALGRLTVGRTPPLSLGQLTGSVVLTAVFFAVEALPLHFEWRGEAYSLSLSEAPLAIGLLVWPSLPLVIARALGGGLALRFHRRQPLQKLVFNVAVQLLEGALALVVYLSIPGHGSTTPMDAAPAAIAAVAASTGVAMLMVCAVIRLLSGHLDDTVVRNFVRTGAFGVPANTAAALVIVTAARHDLLALLPLVIIGLAFGAVHRAYIGLRQRHAGLQTLYEFTRTLGQSASGEHGVFNILERIRELLRCERAALLLCDNDGTAVMRSIDGDGRAVSAPYAAEPSDWPIARVLTSDLLLRLPQGSREPGHQQFLSSHEARDAVLAPVVLGGGTDGVLVGFDRRGDLATFTDDDAQLFANIATQVGNVLDNSRLLDRLRHDSSHDALTGLFNRAHFRAQLVSEVASARPRVAVLLADLDRFKDINDTLGHHHGDLLIAEVARRITAVAAPRGATVARLGGDEFALLVPNADEADALAVAFAVRRALIAPCNLDGVDVEVSASIGIAVCPDHGTEETVLLKRADMAMYAAKTTGTGIETYNDERDEYSPRRLALATQVRGAIDSGQFVLHYQPQVSAADEVVAVEALIRWEHPEFGRVPPDEFIPIAEHSGAIVPLTSWVIREAASQLTRWRMRGLDIAVAVNVSMRNLLDGEIVDVIRDSLTTTGIAPDQLTVEITETHVMSDPTRTLPVLHRLHALGVRLSIDDFGTGYSSLSYLRQLPVHEIKVDKSFVAGTGQQDGAAIISTIVGLANGLGLETVAEGVENIETMKRLQAAGFDRLQGFYIARPMPADQVASWWTKRQSGSQGKIGQLIPLAGVTRSH